VLRNVFNFSEEVDGYLRLGHHLVSLFKKGLMVGIGFLDDVEG
jgi:hypothetical protein